MRIKWQGFIGTNHSWSIVAQNISRTLISSGHDVELISTNGIDLIPNDLLPYLKKEPTGKYDVQLSYTALKNFNQYFQHGDKNRFGIWNYETTVLPEGFAKYHHYCDLLLPSSNFAKNIFADAGIPEHKMMVLPHGIDLHEVASAQPLSLKTKKSVKICANVAQAHIRKHLAGLMDAYGLAFDRNDDVCLVLKIVDKKAVYPWEQSFKPIYARFKEKFKNHAEVEIITDFIPNIFSLYKACDVSYTMSKCEAWWLPGTEGMACGNVVVAPRYGGQLDFLNDNNSLLIDGTIERASLEMQYWTQSPHARVFNPSISDAVDKLRYCVKNIDSLKEKFKDRNDQLIKNLTWTKVVDRLMARVQ